MVNVYPNYILPKMVKLQKIVNMYRCFWAKKKGTGEIGMFT